MYRQKSAQYTLSDNLYMTFVRLTFPLFFDYFGMFSLSPPISNDDSLPCLLYLTLFYASTSNVKPVQGAGHPDGEVVGGSGSPANLLQVD